MGKTGENLQSAFAGESQANRKYLAFAQAADKEGYGMAARLFRAAAQAETVHALAHFRVMKGVKTTRENIKAAIAGEGFEFKEMYPKFLEEARAEGEKGAVTNFSYALAVEKVHHGLYTEALAEVEAGKKAPLQDIWVCPTCGNTMIGVPPEDCPICDTSKSKFMKIE